MKLHFRNLPSCGLPYDNQNSAMTTIVKLYEKIPYLPDLRNANEADTLLNITLSNIPGFKIDGEKISLYENNEYKNFIKLMELTYNNVTEENIKFFKSDSFFMDRYFKAVERIKPHETVIRLYGPFSLMFRLSNFDCKQVLVDRVLRKTFIQMYILKTLWFISKIQSISIKTLPIIIFEEPLLNKFSSIKRVSENIDNDLLIDLYAKIFDKIHKNGGIVGIQCFEKCDWTIAIDSTADIISFDAYHNPHNLNIIAPRINDFLKNGGIINWGIVPMDNADVITKLNSEFAYDKFNATINELINAGVDPNLAYNGALVSVVGDVYKLPLIFSEKALLLVSKVAAKLSTRH